MSQSATASAKALFDLWRRERRESDQQTRGTETPSKTSSLIKDAVSSLPSIQVGGAKNPANAKSPAKSVKAAPTPRMASRASTTPASKSSSRANSSPDFKKNATRASRDEPDTDDSYSVRDQIIAEEPALWDPPFAPTPAKAKTPTKAPNTRRRGARRSSPILDAQSEAEEDTPQKGNTSQKGMKNAQVPNGRAKQGGKKDAQEVSDRKYSLKSLVAHRSKSGEPNLFEVRVHWSSTADGPVETWEPEENLHHDAPRSLFAYWRRVGGREEHMKDPTLWYVESVKRHRVVRDRVELCVSWVGSGELNWEPEGRVEDIASDVVAEYWAGKGGRDACVGGGKKRKGGGGGKKGGAKRARK